MSGDWRISAEDRVKYDSYFQQCNPIQGYLSGDQARKFFVQSNLPADVLRKIWDLSDITTDGRLDKREFTIACHLIASQVQKKAPLPATLPPTLLSDAIAITTNGALPSMPIFPSSITPPGQPLVTNQLLKPANIPPLPLTPANRSKHLQQFHSLVDVTKTNGFMTGLQAKNILQQTGLSQTYLHQIWNLADIDKDGRLTPDEFVIAMHCCDVVRAGQTVPTRVPDEWLQGSTIPRDRTGSLAKSNGSQVFASLHHDLKDAFSSPIPTETHSNEIPENGRKNSIVTYEEKRQQNYEDGFKEIERRRQLLRDQEEREQRQREERERKRELDLQKHKDELERKKQLEYERQLARQQQIEQQREEERRKLFEQRETARKEMERKSRLEWERQRLQELSAQRSRLLEQINDVKSREKALGLELQSMDDTMQTRQTKINQLNTNIQTIDQTINEIQRRTIQEKNLLENIEQQKKDAMMKLHRIQSEKETISSYLQNLNQTKEFSTGNRESDQMRFAKLQLDNIKQENVQIEEQITTMNHQCKQYQNQMEQLRLQLNQLEQNARNAKLSSTNTTTPTPAYANYDQFHASNDFNPLPSSFPIASPSALDVDPFQTVDPFASQSDIGSPSAVGTNSDWFQSPTNGVSPNDPFLSKTEFSSPTQKSIPKTNGKSTSGADPWGGSSKTNNGNTWASFNNTSSPFGTTANDWPQPPPSSTGTTQYRALYDYEPKRSDEVAITAGDIITKKSSEVDPTQQQDENWLFGKIGNDKQGFFPTTYAERILSTPSSTNGNSIDTTSLLTSGSWVIALADYQGKTMDKHLSFQKGEIILVREQKDTTWYSGQLHGKIGWFPRNYVRPASEVEIQNNKNATKSVPTTPGSLDSPSLSKDISSNDNGIADVYVSIYPYEATDTGDLSFDVNERITVLKRDGEWWTGKIGDRIGTFPNNYVQKVENPLQETAIATSAYQGNNENQLSFDQGQIIYIRKKGDKGWYQGEIRDKNQPIRVGWFPANFVQLQNTSSSSPSTPVTTYQNTQEYPRYIANFAYEAQQDDELSFPADAILEILDQGGNTGWFKARYGNQTGLIPSTYVKPIERSTP